MTTKQSVTVTAVTVTPVTVTAVTVTAGTVSETATLCHGGGTTHVGVWVKIVAI